MKKNLILTLIISLLLGLVYKNPVSLVLPAQAQAKTQGSSSLQSYQNLPIIQVVPTPQSASLITTAAPNGCKQVTASLSTGLQNQGSLINLNQPASCFSLQIQTAVIQLPHLAVESNLQNQVKVIVVNVRQNLVSYQVNPMNSDSPALPVLPLSGALITVSLFVFDIKKVWQKSLGLKSKYSFSLELSQLQVLRC